MSDPVPQTNQKATKELLLTNFLFSKAKEADKGMGHARGILAELRRGAGAAPNYQPNCLRLVLPLLPSGATRLDEDAALLIATLFALSPQIQDVDHDFGKTLFLASRTRENQGIERRFLALLAASPEDLPRLLRHAVSLASREGVNIGWQRLYYDVRDLMSGYPDKLDRVRRRWARSFWGNWPDKNDESKSLESK